MDAQFAKTLTARVEEFGRRLKKRRQRLGLTLQDLAKKTGLSPSYLSNLEKSFQRRPDAPTVPSDAALDALARALEVPFAQLNVWLGRGPLPAKGAQGERSVGDPTISDLDVYAAREAGTPMTAEMRAALDFEVDVKVAVRHALRAELAAFWADFDPALWADLREAGLRRDLPRAVREDILDCVRQRLAQEGSAPKKSSAEDVQQRVSDGPPGRQPSPEV